jgi:S1-C subfamily serine protease/photosystem II stability/assembly factor-like uncharacterized protein
VFPRRRILFPVFLMCLACAGFGFLAAAPSAPGGEEKSREQQIKELEQQIQELTRKLGELKNGAPAPAADNTGVIPPDWIKALHWRSLGPAAMGGRISAISVFEADPSTYWIATASGGLLKTVNNGVTFEHQFDHEKTVSIGDVCVAPSDRNIVWVGTGEANPRNSVSYGDGVYKSVDGGKSWQHMGLEKTFQIGKIVVHPTSPNIVYVGALGRLYGPNPERGLFKTIDGGKTWERVFFTDDKTGVIDLRMHPTDPETLIVAMWERRRDEFDSHRGEPPVADGYDAYDPIEKWGATAGIYKTADGGKSFRKLTNGLPTCKFGRVGLDFYRKNPNTLFAVVDCEKIGMGTPPSQAYLGVRGEDVEGGGGAKLVEVGADAPAGKAGLKEGDIIKAIDKTPITKYDQIVEQIQAHNVGDKLTLTVLRDKETKDYVVTLERRPGAPEPPPKAVAGFTGEDVEGGVKITQLVPQGPAEKAGLKKGDVIKALDKKEIKNLQSFAEQMRDHKPGDKVAFSVLRDNESVESIVTLDPPPAPDEAPGGRRGGLIGLQGEDVEGGVKVTQMVPEGSAEKAGVKVGDIIKAVDKKEVKDQRSIFEEMRGRRPGDKVTLTVLRDKETKELEVTLQPRQGGPGAPRNPNRPYVAALSGQIENAQSQQGPDSFQYGGIYKSIDGGETWTRINSLNPRPMYFSQIRVDPGDENNLYVCGIALYRSKDGGKKFTDDGGKSVHPDQHALWIDPRDSRHMIVGCDGGFYVTYDRMDHWDHLNHAAIGQFYHVAVDNRKPYRVYGGLQDNGSWGGPSHSLTGSGPVNDDWFDVFGGDGFVCRVDSSDPDCVYAEMQDGGIFRRNLRTGESGNCRPRNPQGQPPYRFNWNTPFFLSNHNARIFYSGGNLVFRSFKQGDDLRPISPEITRTKRGSASALAESPKNPDLLYAGTDDGYLWITRDGGAKWTNITDKVGLPGPRWVASIEASRYVEGRAYVAFDGHRSDDDAPYVYVTEDFGQTWKSLRANLPAGSSRVLREDIENPNLLYLGTEFAAWASLDRGQTWVKINNNLPTVAVHEFAQPTTANDLVAATHGRSIWILDVKPLRQMTPEVLKAKTTLFQPSPAVRWRNEPAHGEAIGGGDRRFHGDNPPGGAQIYYALSKKADKIALKIVDFAGKTVGEPKAPPEPGLHRISWNLGRTPKGMYRVVLTVDGEEFTKSLSIEADPTRPETAIAADGDEEDEMQAEKEEKVKAPKIID